jgi:hypothetical protein
MTPNVYHVILIGTLSERVLVLGTVGRSHVFLGVEGG